MKSTPFVDFSLMSLSPSLSTPPPLSSSWMPLSRKVRLWHSHGRCCGCRGGEHDIHDCCYDDDEDDKEEEKKKKDAAWE